MRIAKVLHGPSLPSLGMSHLGLRLVYTMMTDHPWLGLSESGKRLGDAFTASASEKIQIIAKNMTVRRCREGADMETG